MDEGQSSKVYGLSFPTRKNEDKQKLTVQNVFNVESDEETEVQKLKPLTSTQNSEAYQAKIHRKTKSDFEKAIVEDPSVFQYDEIYEEICSEKARKVSDALSGTKKQAKYVNKLLKSANERKLERELCSERKAQKEIEAEAELYGDKESFVTSAYKEKLGELRDLVSRREEEHQRETIMDITGQDGLGGFYRYMYQHGIKDRSSSVTKEANSTVAQETLDENTKACDSKRHSTDDESQISSNNKRDHDLHKPENSQGGRDSKSRPKSRFKEESKSQHNSDNSRDIAKNRNESPSRSSTNEHRLKDSKGLSGDQSSNKENPAASSRKSSSLDPNFIYARPRVTTDEQIEAARQRYFARKSAGIVPVTADSDSD